MVQSRLRNLTFLTLKPSTGPYTTARLTELMHIAPLMNLYSEEAGSVKYETLLDKRGELLLKLLIDVRTGGEEA